MSDVFEQPDFSGVETAEDDDVSDESYEDTGASTPEESSPNAVEGGTAKSVLEHIAAAIVDDKDSVVVDVRESRGQLRLDLHVAPSDMGRIIGRRGRTAQALRTVVRAAAASEGRDVVVDIVD